MTLIRRGAFALLAGALLLTGCAGDDDAIAPANPFRDEIPRRLQELAADEAYRLARRSLEAADYEGAIAQYRAILLRFPFTDYATQAQLELIYANYKAYAPESALADADRFLREHPRHPEIEYVYYLRGLVHYARSGSEGDLTPWTRSETYDPTFARRAFDAFGLLIQRFPKSQYAADARQRMILLRDRLAQHDMAIAAYYLKRHAYVAAARRAEDIVNRYQGTSVVDEAMTILETAYSELDMPELAESTRKLARANFADWTAGGQATGADADIGATPQTNPDVPPPALSDTDAPQTSPDAQTADSQSQPAASERSRRRGSRGQARSGSDDGA